MVPRATLIAVLAGVEVALLVAMLAAIRGAVPWRAWPAQAATAPRQTGTYRFHAGASTSVRVAIGEAGFVGIDKRLVRVTLPPGVRVNVEHAGDVTLAGLLTATSSDGHIRVADAACGSLNVRSSDGRLVLERVRADRITAATGDGRVDGGLVLHDGSISSDDGNVDLTQEG